MHQPKQGHTTAKGPVKGQEKPVAKQGESEPLAQAAAAYQSTQLNHAQPNDILTLQRTSGNRAVQRLLTQSTTADTTIQRDDAQNNQRVKDTGVDASMFTLTGGDIKAPGKVSAKKKGTAEVSIETPSVSYEARVTLMDDVSLGKGSSVMTGPVQTLMSSSRVAVYREGGQPNGKIVAEKHVAVGTVRDAHTSSDGSTDPNVVAPWYSAAVSVNDATRSTPVNFMDQPGFDVPQTIGKGILTETRGKDSFVTSVGVQRDGQLVHLKSMTWEAPWDVTMNNFQGEGGTVPVGEAKSPPPVTDGPIAAQAAVSWLGFPTLEAAQGASTTQLLNNLSITRSQDPVSYQNIVEALKTRSITANFVVDDTDSILSSDKITLYVQGQKMVNKGTFTLNDGESTTLTIGFQEIFDDMGSLDSSSIELQATVGGNVKWHVLPFPFTGKGGALSEGSGSGAYRVEYTLG